MSMKDAADKFLADHPDGKVYLYDVGLRGGPGPGPGWGVFIGSHFQMTFEYPSPFGGDPVKIFSPLMNAADVPSDLAPGAVPIADLIGMVQIQQQATNDAQAAEIQSLNVKLTAAGVKIDELQKALASAKAENLELKADLAAAKAKPST